MRMSYNYSLKLFNNKAVMVMSRICYFSAKKQYLLNEKTYFCKTKFKMNE